MEELKQKLKEMQTQSMWRKRREKREKNGRKEKKEWRWRWVWKYWLYLQGDILNLQGDILNMELWHDLESICILLLIGMIESKRKEYISSNIREGWRESVAQKL